jgi:hypothetical protein
MSLFALQLDVGATSVFLFERAVALRSYWLSQGIAAPGWKGLISSIQSLQITKSASRNANRRVKRIQAETKTLGDWVMGVRKGDMIGTLNEHEPTWSALALLLPITAVFPSQDAADILVFLSTKGYNTALGPGALVKQNSDALEDKPLDFETAHNIITATAPYVGVGYELRGFSDMLKTVLQAFDGKSNSRIAEACKWRPTSSDIVSLLQQISAAQGDNSVHVIVTTGKGIDVICWLAVTLFECTVTLSVDGQAKPVAKGQGPSVMVAVLPAGQVSRTYNYANARIGASGNEAQKEEKQWDIIETRWTLSDYLQLRTTSWAFSKEAIEELNNFIADRVLAFWSYSRIYGSLGGHYAEGLKSAKVDHRLSDEPAPGVLIKDLFSIDTVITRVRSFDPLLADILDSRANMPDPVWPDKKTTYATTKIQTFGPYCPCVRHKGELASPSVFGKDCVIQQLREFSHFFVHALCTLLFISAPYSTAGVPLNCGQAVQKLVNNLPDGMHRGSQLNLSHILEAAVLLLGNTFLASQASARDVLGLHAFGVSIIPNLLVTTDTQPAENLIFLASPGALYCRGVGVTSVRNSDWANTGGLAFGGPPITPEKIIIVPANDPELAVLDSGSSHSQVLVEASVEESAGYIAFRISWTLNGDEVNEYVSPLDVLYGMSGIPYVICTCTRRRDNHSASSPSSESVVMLCNAASSIFSPLDRWNYPDHSYATSTGLTKSECLGGFDGVIVTGMKDRGHLLRALRYNRNKVRMRDSCLECATKFAANCADRRDMIIME